MQEALNFSRVAALPSIFVNIHVATKRFAGFKQRHFGVDSYGRLG